jgi:hypothetical protein
MKYLLLFLCFVEMVGQSSGPDAFLKKIDALKKLSVQADSATWQLNDSLGYNDKINTALSEILKDRRSTKNDLDKLLGNYLDIEHSLDKKLWIFGWAENSGGTFRAIMNVIQWRSAQKPQIAYDEFTTIDTIGTYNPNQNVFVSNGASFYKIIKLRSKKNYYLCLGQVVGCSTCCSEVATVIELTRDSINFNYPAFENDTLSNTKEGSTLKLDSRCGYITKFEYDDKTQTISYEYEPNDLTPVYVDMDQQASERPHQNEPVKQTLYWDGSTFSGRKR